MWLCIFTLCFHMNLCVSERGRERKIFLLLVEFHFKLKYFLKNSLQLRPKLVDPIDYETFVVKNKAVLHNDPQLDMVNFPHDDVELPVSLSLFMLAFISSFFLIKFLHVIFISHVTVVILCVILNLQHKLTKLTDFE